MICHSKDRKRLFDEVTGIAMALPPHILKPYRKKLIFSRFHGTISAVRSARKTRNKEILNHEYSA